MRKLAERSICLLVVISLAGCISRSPEVPTAQPEPGSAVDISSDGLVLATSNSSAQLAYNFARAIAVDEVGTVHVVWHDGEGVGGDIFYIRSSDGGINWDELQVLGKYQSSEGQVSIDAAGRNVYIVWHDHHVGLSTLRMIKSNDRGVSWGTVEAVVEHNQGVGHPSVAATGSNVYLVWGDHRDGPHAEIYTIRSKDQGETWEAEQRLSDVPYESWVPSITTSGDNVYIAWVDYQDGNEEEYFTRSMDAGSTWDSPLRLTIDSADSWAPSIQVSGEVVHLTWFDRRHAEVSEVEIEEKVTQIMEFIGLRADPIPLRDPAVYYLNPFQERFQAKMHAIQEAVPLWVSGGGDPKTIEQMMIELESLNQKWHGGWEIYYLRSPDEGRTWDSEVRLTFAEGVSMRPSLDVVGQNLSLVWFDYRDGNQEIYTLSSQDGGLTWEPERRLTYSTASSQRPSVALTVEATHVVWLESAGVENSIMYLRLPTDPSPTN